MHLVKFERNLTETLILRTIKTRTLLVVTKILEMSKTTIKNVKIFKYSFIYKPNLFILYAMLDIKYFTPLYKSILTENTINRQHSSFKYNIKFSLYMKKLQRNKIRTV